MPQRKVQPHRKTRRPTQHHYSFGDRAPAAPLLVVHEDDDVIIVDKPAGLPTVTPPKQTADNLFSQVKASVRERAKRRGTQVWIIHRLDREASGLLVFAKSERAFESLKAQLRARSMQREYVAVASGTFDASPGENEHTGSVQSFLFEDARGHVHSVSTPTGVPKHLRHPTTQGDDDETNAARPAVTHYRVTAQGSGKAILRVRLETGRKHQIRVHLQSINHPILGDRKYGAPSDPLERLCLHACELAFTHPATGKLARYTSPVPGTFSRLVAGGAKAVTPEPPKVPEQSWNHVAEWYDQFLQERVSDHHEQVILPGTIRLLGAKRGDRVLDVACGQGILCRRLAALGAVPIGVDSSAKLLSRARELGRGEYLAADARELGGLNLAPADGASCVMAIMNIDPIAPVFAGVASRLRSGAPFVLVLLHPAFRAPGQTSWGWDAARQYRRVDAYLSSVPASIVMNPGAVSSGRKPIVTMTYHRPIHAYINGLAGAGFRIDAMEEWASARVSEPGPKAAEENRARREFPMFLAIRAIRA